MNGRVGVVPALALLAVTAAVGCGRDEGATGVGGAGSARIATGAADSNIAARDYIGPAACGECHPEQHARWQASLHAAMNRRVDAERSAGAAAVTAAVMGSGAGAEAGATAAVIGDFDATLAYAGGEARFSREGGAPVMTLARPASEGRPAARVRYRVTRTIGRRGLQEYVGVEDGGPGHAGGAGEEVRLPMGWWPARGGWFPQPYFDPWLDEDDLDVYAPVREPWAERCPWCHSTYPFELRVARASRSRRVGHGLEQHFASAPGSERLAVERQVTTGISCESCHLGGRAHAAGARMTFVPVGAAPRPGAPEPSDFARERRDPAIVGAVCAQCHSGPSPRFPDGAALRNSSESLDLAAGPCTGIRCIDCHDPHGGGPAGPAGTTIEERALAACTGCHAPLADPARASTHAGGAGHGGVSCLDCHMPRMVMGIDRYVRSHRISSPTDPAMLGPAPNACNLCHLDRSLGWTLGALARRHRVALDPGRLAGPLDLDTAAGPLWLASLTAGVRLIAAAAYGRSGLGRAALPALLPGLDDELPHVRAWTELAVEAVLGRRLTSAEYDPRAPASVRRAQLERLGARAQAQRRPR